MNATRGEARGALWTGVVSFIACFAIVLLFGWMVLDAMPGAVP